LHLLAAFEKTYPQSAPDWVIQLPDREVWIAAAAHIDFMLYSADHNASTQFSYRSAKLKRTLLQRPLPSWSRYAAGTIVQLLDSGLEISGFKAAVISESQSNLPARYDHAVGLAIAALCHQIGGRPYSPDAILEIVEKTRRQYVE
jgi:hypothetical protein